MRSLFLYVFSSLALTGMSAAQAVPQIRILVLECDNAMNDIRSGTACEPRVRVEDENGEPVVGAAVAFLLPDAGPGGSFPGKLKSLVVRTDNKGEAVARGLSPNQETGPFRIRIQVTTGAISTETSLVEINALPILPAAEKSASKNKMWAILGGTAVAAAIAMITLRGEGSNRSTDRSNSLSIVPGKPNVGPPE